MIRYALKTWKKIAFPALWFWIGAVYLGGRAIHLGTALYQEKNQPCLLHVTSAEAMDMEVVGGISGILSCTVLYEVDATVSAAGYEADFNIQGVDSSFISGYVADGTLFTELGGMPELVMNEAALETFALDGKKIESIESVDWLNTGINIKTGDERPIAAAICGIIHDEKESPSVYMSLSAARNYLMQQGVTPVMTSALVKVRTAGIADNVTDNLEKLGYMAENTEDHTQEWQLSERKLYDSILAAVIAALAALALLRAHIRIDTLSLKKSEHKMAVNGIRCFICLIYGAIIGIIILIIARNAIL